MNVDFRSFVAGMYATEKCFCIVDTDNKVVYSTDEYNEIIRSSKIIDDSIYCCSNKFYSPTCSKIITENGTYKTKVLKNVTPLYSKLVNLKNDEVTGLPIRKELDRYLEKLSVSGERKIIVMCDIDNFKQYNDNYGHTEGDVILNHICSNFKKNIRYDDYIGRFGGEEFLIIFNTSDVRVVKERLNLIRKDINNDSLLSSKGYNVTFSAGIAIYDGKCNVNEAIKQADKGVYCVKGHGKNGDAIYDEKSKVYILLKK